MDARAVVGRLENDAARAEQAVFTSVRSPWGRGYQIVAASPGITADEKREIVRRAPSHGSICDESPEGRGLAVFALQSGRHCLFLARNSGREHSGRGQWRVYTHVLVLDAAAYRGLRSDPLAVASAARAALGGVSLEGVLPHLAPLSLPLAAAPVPSGAEGATGCAACDSPISAPGDMDGWKGGVGAALNSALLARLLQGRRVFAAGIPAPLRGLAWLWSAVPAVVRHSLSVSCGLRFSPLRNFTLVLTEAARGEARRIGQEYGFDVLGWGADERPTVSEPSPWLACAQRYWALGRRTELDSLSAGITDATPAHLARAAGLADDLERVSGADAPEAAT